MAAIELRHTSLFDDANLKAYYQLEANGNDSKNSYTLTGDTAPTYAAGKFNNGADFNGTTDCLKTSAWDFTLFDSGGSFSLWVYPQGNGEGAANDGPRILNTSSIVIHAPNGDGSVTDLFVQAMFSTTAGIWKATDVLTINAWNHIVITYNNSATTNDPIIYVNGSSVSVTESQTPVGTRTAFSEEGYIGNNSASGVRAFDGIMDDVAMFDRILSGTEVSNLYTGSLPGASSPSLSISFSPSVSVSLSPSISVSASPSASQSPSSSVSLSPSLSPSSSVSLSMSFTSSPSPSLSASASQSPSSSESLSPSFSASLSISLTPSASPSLSTSASISPSPSASVSLSPSMSVSASPSPPVWSDKYSTVGNTWTAKYRGWTGK